MKPINLRNQYNLTPDEQDELDAFLVELDTQSRLEQEENYVYVVESVSEIDVNGGDDEIY